MNFTEWAEKWELPAQAMAELAELSHPQALQQGGHVEAEVQARLRIAASKKDIRLWRNNVGAYATPEGSYVRFGLCNDSKRMNEMLKSSDLIGIRPVLIQAENVGQKFGQFVAREVKGSSWHYTGSKREQAQLAFLTLVNSLGGDACFATGEDAI